MRLAICDRDAAFLRRVERMLWQMQELSTASFVFFTDPDWLLQDVESHADGFDILIVNRSLGKRDGVELAARVLRANPWCKVIFLCEENRFAPELYSVAHTFALAKEQLSAYLMPAVEKAVAELDAEAADCLRVTSQYTRLLVPVSKVIYLERIARKTNLVCVQETIECAAAPAQILGERLGRRFVQCHRSFFVNRMKIRGVQSDRLLMSNGAEIPVGRTFFAAAESAFAHTAETRTAVRT